MGNIKMVKSAFKFIQVVVIFSMIINLVGCGPLTPIPSQETSPTTESTSETETVNTQTPNTQPNTAQDVWLDDSIDPKQFSPSGKFIFHFKNPIALTSSATPVLSWPSVDGISSWNEDKTTLTFNPNSVLDSKKTYTFFLDPELKYESGENLQSLAEWTIYVKNGPKILSLIPAVGALDKLHKNIEIKFDRKMLNKTDSVFTIQPNIQHEISWKDSKTLQIILEEPLAIGQRYDLILKGESLFSEDGSYLSEDYSWFYWQNPLDVSTKVSKSSKVVQFNFNYTIDTEKTGFPFSFSPSLNGEWSWITSQQLQFKSDKVIPSSIEYELIANAPLVDISGAEIGKIPTSKFSGREPFRLKMTGLNEYQYVDMLTVDAELDAIRIEFDYPVNHISAEKAFSITPALPGKFQWEKVKNSSKEILVYTLDELLTPSVAYTLNINKTLLDSENKKIITQNYQQKFQREYWEYLTPSFGEAGDNIQVIDANGSRRLQISGNDPDVSFSAYSFDISEYASLYANYYHPRQRAVNVIDIPTPSDLNPSLIWYGAKARAIKDNEIIETTIPPELLPGLYVINLKVKNRLYDQLFLVISENTLVVKNDGDDLFVWLTNINGEVVEDAEIRVYSSTGEKIREGTTDSQGLYNVSIPEGINPSLVSALIKRPGQPNDAIVTGVDTRTWGSNFPYDYYERRDRNLPEGKPYLTYIYTERPIYRPGQTVNFKIILRKDDDLKYQTIEEGTPVQVRIKDARGNTIDNYELTSNKFGTINGTVNISEGAMLGLYTIEAEISGLVNRQNFKVEDYKKPDYKITITSLQPEKLDTFVQGEEVKVQVNASYFFGEPLINTKIKVDFFISPYSYNTIKTNISGELITDENGNAMLSFKSPYNEQNNDNYYYNSYYWGNRLNTQLTHMLVSIDDGSNQVVTGRYDFQVHPASEKISLDTGGYFFAPNKSFPVKVNVSSLLGELVTGREVSLTIQKWDRSKYEFNTTTDNFSLQTNEQGVAIQELVLTSGYYQLSLSAKDADGRKMEYSGRVYIFKSTEDWYFTNRWEVLQIYAEKDSYKPYEKAKFMIESTFSGSALITFERGSVINSKLIELTAPLTIFETDIIPEHAPNVYVTVNAWQPASDDVFRFGSYDTYTSRADSYMRADKTQILVDATAKELQIEIATDQAVYEPGGTVTATINVKDAQGNPVESELSLAVVDESIFSLSNELEKNIFEAFYGPRAHTVNTFDAMSPYRVIVAGDAGGGGDGEPPQPRQDFLDTSTWLPVIYTDENGQSTVTFDLPDNTTSWRLTVKAVTLKHQVGQANINIETKKEVFLRPILPRILTRGDQANLTAFLHNYSAEAKTIKVNLIADGLEVQGQNEETITLKPNEVVPIGWRVIVNRATPTEITITAQENQDILDIVKVPLLIQPEAVRDIQNQSGEFNGTVVLPLMLPEVDTETSQVVLSLNQSMSGTLLNGLEYLTGFPYGCVEQTMSRALPNAVVGRASQQLGIGGPNLQNQVDPLIQASITKLYSLQHSDGGWGWWTDDASDAYQTAWVLFGLGVLNNSGYPIEPQVLDDAEEWLTTNSFSSSYYSEEDDIRTQAYALYSLAMADRGNLEQTQKLVDESIYELDTFSQAALALALHKMGEEEKAREILNLISQSALKESEFVYFPQSGYDGEYQNKTMSSTVRTTAMVLLAYSKIDPQNDLISGMVEYLASKRQGIYGWGTTNETSFVILALTEYFVSQESEQGTTPYQVFINDVKQFEGKLEIGNTSVLLEIPAENLEHGKNDIRITTDDDRILYFDISTKYDLTQEKIEAAGNVKITRRYLDPKTKKALETIEAGQVVKVEISVTMPENAYYVAVEDYLPGGLEALNEGLNSENQVSFDSMWGGENYTQFFWQDYGYNYKEIRGDRVVFFITTFEKGKRIFTYFARAITTGDFTALSTQVYAMYDSSMWGRSEKIEIEVK